MTFRRRTFAESERSAPGVLVRRRPGPAVSGELLPAQGTFGAKGVGSTPSREPIFTCRPSSGADSDAQARCAKEIVSSLATRAYRRPVSAEDVGGISRLTRGRAERRRLRGRHSNAVTGILASPFFLYRGERVPSNARGTSTRSTPSSSRRSCRSVLWNSIPDEELLQRGIDGTLSEPAVLDRQVRRGCWPTPRVETLASNFVHDRLDMRRLDEMVRRGRVPVRLRQVLFRATTFARS